MIFSPRRFISYSKGIKMQTNVTEFVFVGLFMNREMKILSFIFFLLCYFAILLGNSIVLITISYSYLIQQPMYYFLCHLSLMDLGYTSTIIPRLIRDLVAKRKNISYNSCMTQLFSIHLLGGVEIFILVSMAFDRYIAICKPLHYLIIMNRKKCNLFILLAWVVAFWHSIAQLLTILSLPFCGPNQIDHYICDVKALLQLVCTDTKIVSSLVIANTGMVALVTFLVLVSSYIAIFYNLRTCSSEGRGKALSTCGSHIMVVFLFFVPCISTYVPPPRAGNSDKEFSIFYTVMAPMLNPLIYTLRNSEMKNAMQKVWSRKKSLLFNLNM
ncbi:LOW QUALITY PROTEIN: olfactory receptor 4P4-like [Trichosurus vulpecula]|uniref:LOW QUALITY PROTEIN: olfactory receptor 4P4-like n=1 Tax=Trichosurus vulpecula TaxID=9337 RepID=UPI00186AD765|nr:LOW QUALITY PROTEIN: olfactory receptor 4P4-like [Trichosurus vulpecula]